MKKLSVLFLFLVITILFSSCNVNKSPTHITTNETGRIDNTGSGNSKNDYQIKIYRLSREAFASFLDTPSSNLLNSTSDQIFSYPDDGNYHNSVGAIVFCAKQAKNEIEKSKSVISNLLSDNNISNDIIEYAIIDTPHVPFTLWLKTANENVYITIDPSVKDPTQKYILYTYEQFHKIYSAKNGTLVVNGKDVLTDKSIPVYYDYADLPLLTVLKALGAEVLSETSSETHIEFKKIEYIVNAQKISLCDLQNKTDNLLNKVIGMDLFIYASNNEIIVDSKTLQTVLSFMGENVTIQIITNDDSQEISICIDSD